MKRENYKLKNSKAAINIGDEPIKYESLAQGSFTKWPKDFKKVRQMKTREELLKTNYELGVSKVDYQTANMDQFKSPADPSYNTVGGRKFKNYNKRIDIITG